MACTLGKTTAIVCDDVVILLRVGRRFVRFCKVVKHFGQSNVVLYPIL